MRVKPRHTIPGWRRGGGTRHPMAKVIEIKTKGNEEDLGHTLDEIAREGARRMLIEALEAEVEDYIGLFQDRDEGGHDRLLRMRLYRLRAATRVCGSQPCYRTAANGAGHSIGSRSNLSPLGLDGF